MENTEDGGYTPVHTFLVISLSTSEPGDVMRSVDELALTVAEGVRRGRTGGGGVFGG